jgi:hypothetical protein
MKQVSSSEAWHWVGIFLGVLTNAVIYGTCRHVDAVYSAGPVGDKEAALRPVWICLWGALLLGLPVSWLTWKEGARAISIVGFILNTLAVLQALVFGSGTAIMIMY